MCIRDRAQILPWVFVTRCVFIYHFFASVPFIIIMIVYAFKDMEERFGWFRHISNWFVVLCGLLFEMCIRDSVNALVLDNADVHFHGVVRHGVNRIKFLDGFL